MGEFLNCIAGFQPSSQGELQDMFRSWSACIEMGSAQLLIPVKWTVCSDGYREHDGRKCQQGTSAASLEDEKLNRLDNALAQVRQHVPGTVNALRWFLSTNQP